jgi:dihydropteroate synthase
MGILNVTPDSFSDGGKFYTIQNAVDQALRLEDQGADILDIGGESTRPYSQPVSWEEELQRVAPVMEKLLGRLNIPISIDTTKSQVAAVAMDLGAEIINDVSGLSFDPDMIALACKTKAGVCAMHMQGNPQNMQDAPHYDNVVQEILRYLETCNRRLEEQGVAPECICLDPGIGFGKSHEHNWTLVREVEQFHALQRPLLVGHSRKGFIAKVLGSKDIDRIYGTLGVSMALAAKGVQVLRVHDVAANKQALQLFAESQSELVRKNLSA